MAGKSALTRTKSVQQKSNTSVDVHGGFLETTLVLTLVSVSGNLFAPFSTIFDSEMSSDFF
jgi:hypothetical protein